MKINSKKIITLILFVILLNCIYISDVFSETGSVSDSSQKPDIQLKGDFLYIRVKTQVRKIQYKVAFFNASDPNYILACLKDSYRFAVINKSTLKVRITGFTYTKNFLDSPYSLLPVNPIIGYKNKRSYFISGTALVMSTGISEKIIKDLGKQGCNKESLYVRKNITSGNRIAITFVSSLNNTFFTEIIDTRTNKIEEVTEKSILAHDYDVMALTDKEVCFFTYVHIPASKYEMNVIIYDGQKITNLGVFPDEFDPKSFRQDGNWIVFGDYAVNIHEKKVYKQII